LSVSEDQKEDGYVYRWFNNTPGRLEQAGKAGYEFVDDATAGDAGESNTDLGSRTSAVVDRVEGTRAYLMRIRQDWYDEDQAQKQLANDAIDDAIRGGKVAESDNQYIPKSGINYKP
jgi:hypothetical protein